MSKEVFLKLSMRASGGGQHTTERWPEGPDEVVFFALTRHPLPEGEGPVYDESQTAERASGFAQTVRHRNSGTHNRAATIDPRRNGALLRVHRRGVHHLSPLRSDTPDEGRHLLHRSNQGPRQPRLPSWQ